MNKDFYVINNNLFEDSSFGFGEQTIENYNTGKAQYCSGCKFPISLLEWLPPFEINVSKKELGDFIFGTYPGFIVSERFKLEYLKSNLNGLSEFNKVDLYYRKNRLSAPYFYPKIPLINAFVDLNLIDLEDKNLCNVCQKGSSIINKICGVKFINSDFIKEDIFFTTSLGQAQIFVSSNFKKFVDSVSFKNIEFVKDIHFKWDSL